MEERKDHQPPQERTKTTRQDPGKNHTFDSRNRSACLEQQQVFDDGQVSMETC